jgi:hypothetical protein
MYFRKLLSRQLRLDNLIAGRRKTSVGLLLIFILYPERIVSGLMVTYSFDALH